MPEGRGFGHALLFVAPNRSYTVPMPSTFSLATLLVLIAGACAANTQDAHPSPASSPPLQIAFTFDDLPAHGPLPPGMARPAVAKSILATLKREQMPPVYGFINGFRVAQYPYQIHILQAWRAAGEPLGNHTWSHPSLDQSSVSSYERNIARNEPLLRKVDANGDWHWFRYPFLEEGNTVAKREAVRGWLAKHGYRIAEVSMDFQDYQWNDVYARCSVKHEDAAFASLHDSYLASADQSIREYRKLAQKLYGHDVPYVLLMHVGAFDAKMLPELIALFRSRGFTFITLEQAMSDPVYRIDPPVTSPGGSTFNEFVASDRKVDGPDLIDRSKELDAMCK